MDKWTLLKMGTHDALVANPNGLYAHLWKMQDGGKPMDGAQH